MADNKGIYFGGGNRGLATILDSGETERTRARLSMDEQRKVAQQVADKERRDKQAEQLKNFDAWRVYQPALQKKYDDIANRLKKGELDPFTLRQELNDYAGKAQASMQLQDEWKQASADYEKNKKVLGNAADWYIQSYHGDPSVDNLTKISSNPLNRYGFLDESGGSKYLNPTNSFNDVIEKALPGWIEQETINAAGKGKTVARGLMEFQQQHDLSKLKSFTEVDPKTGEIKVKDADKLIDSGVLELFQSDPYTRRILQDKTDEIIGTTEVSPEDRQRIETQVLRTILNPYGSQGLVKSESKKDFRSYSVPSPSGGGGSGGDDKEKAQRIYDVFKSRGIGQGIDVGESKKYTKEALMKIGYSEEKADELVKKGAQYMESSALAGWKNEAGDILGNIVWSKYNKKRFDSGIAKVQILDKDGKFKREDTLTLNQLQAFLPISVYKEVEKIARDDKRLDKSGNFIYRPKDNLE